MASTTTPTGVPSRPATPRDRSRAATPSAAGGDGAGAAALRGTSARPTGTAGAASKAESGGGGAGKKASGGKKGKGVGGLSTRGKVAAATAAAAGVAAATAAGVAAVKAIRRRRGADSVYHVEPKGEDWQVRKEGAERASGVYGTKKEAIAAGRGLAQKNEPSRLVIHGGDGSVQRKHSYGDLDE